MNGFGGENFYKNAGLNVCEKWGDLQLTNQRCKLEVWVGVASSFNSHILCLAENYVYSCVVAAKISYFAHVM